MSALEGSDVDLLHAEHALHDAIRDHRIRIAHQQAIAKLQIAVTRFPKAQEFGETETMLKGILSGSVKAPVCENPH